MAKKKHGKEQSFQAEPEEILFEVKEAMDVAMEIVRVIEEEIEEYTKVKHEDYFESVMDKARAIYKTIKNSNHASKGQRNALDNMLAGIKKWVHEDE